MRKEIINFLYYYFTFDNYSNIYKYIYIYICIYKLVQFIKWLAIKLTVFRQKMKKKSST